MKRWIALAAVITLLACAMIPRPAYTEDRDTVLLARAIYALAREESYETKLAIGTLAMNRVENPWFAGTLSGVLNEQHQFPIGSRYDEASLAAAHEVLSGRRTLGADALYYRALSATEAWQEAPVAEVGGYVFYAENGNL